MDALSVFIGKIVSLIIQPLVALLVTAGVAYFIWGVAMFFLAEKGEDRKKGTQHLLYGVIGVVIMVAVIGILEIALATFDIQRPY